MATNRINFNLRITEELNNELMEIANKEKRSKNAEIEHILEEYVKNYNKTENEKMIEQQNNNLGNGTQINVKK